MPTSPSRRSFLSAAIVSTGLSLVDAPAFAVDPEAAARFVPPEPAGERLAVKTPDGLQLSARAYGNPAHPEIVLVHGLGQSRLSWALQTSGLLTDRFLQGLPVYSIAGIPFSSHDLRAEEATPHRTDCTSTGGLVALNGAGPDTNRSAGLHSGIVVAIMARLKPVRVHLLPV